MEDQPRGFAALIAAFRDASRRRKLASIAIALTLEGLILLLLLTLGTQIAGVKNGEKVTTFKALEFAAPPAPEPETAAEASTADTPQETTPVPQSTVRPSPLTLNPQPAPPAPPQPPQQQPETPPEPQPQARPSPKIGARIRPGAAAGPADTGNPRNAGDSQQVGTAPNGEPLYAARWYREPTQQELAGYLSTANGPGSALIACKTVPDYYVDDCVLISETPQGSMMGRATLAAAWQFRVRPARVGGRDMVGSWVRIRIDYTVRRAKP